LAAFKAAPATVFAAQTFSGFGSESWRRVAVFEFVFISSPYDDFAPCVWQIQIRYFSQHVPIQAHVLGAIGIFEDRQVTLAR
jgi:hypothetical protein